MKKIKFDCGIYLGIAESMISRIEEGKVKIIKSKTYNQNSTPTCISFNMKSTMFVGQNALKQKKRDEIWTRYFKSYDINTFSEFLRTIGTDTQYFSNNMKRSYSSEELLGYIIKELRSYVDDDEIESAIITIPAKFKQNEMNAVKRAAELGGLRYFELLQEPIAVSLAYGADKRTHQGYWFVFHFDETSFNVSILTQDDGSMDIVDTAGDKYLGGINLDNAIVDDIIIPQLKQCYSFDGIMDDEAFKQAIRNKLKWYAKETREALNQYEKFGICSGDPIGQDDEGIDIDLDLRISLKEFEIVSEPIFQRAIDIAMNLLVKNRLLTEKIQCIYLSGSVTLSQTLQRMLKSQVIPTLDTSIDPITAPAIGAALYSSVHEKSIYLKQNVPIEKFVSAGIKARIVIETLRDEYACYQWKDSQRANELLSHCIEMSGQPVVDDSVQNDLLFHIYSQMINPDQGVAGTYMEAKINCN